MVRNIFTIVAAFPVDVAYHELPRVRVDTFVVEGPNLREAFEAIKEHVHIVGATEVFGVPLREIYIGPDMRLSREEKLEQWAHWPRLVQAGEFEGWELLAKGPESFDQRSDRLFAERHPEFA